MAIASVGAIPAFFIVDGEGPTPRSLESSDDEEDEDEEGVAVVAVVDNTLDDDDCLSLHSETTYGAATISSSPTSSKAQSRVQSGKVSKASSSTNLLG